MTADQVYVDPSALASLYIHETRSRAMCTWRVKLGGTLLVTHQGRTEIVNAICRVAFLGQVDEAGLAAALADFANDFAHGQLRQADLLWRSALDRAAQLSRNHTPKIGTRTLDVIHVACALELKLRHFLTFDTRQQRLAAAAGLKVSHL